MLKKSLLIILLPFFGIFLAILFVEGIVRVSESLVSGPPRWSDRPGKYFQYEGSSTLQDYKYEPLARHSSQSDAHSGVFRIAVIGDSFTFAPYMQFTDAFPKVLERMLNLNQGAPRVEVVNYGVPAYSTSHEVDVAKQAANEGADLIILQFTLNDPELKPLRPTGITQFGTWGPYAPTGWTKQLFSYWHTGFLVAQRLHNARTKKAYVEYFLDLFNGQRTFKVFKDSVTKIHNIAQRRSIPMIGVIFPLFGTPLDQSYPFYSCHNKIAELLDGLKVPHLDLLSIYKGISLERLQVIPGEDRHPNEIGHRMAAEAIYQYLEEHSLIPDSVRIRKWSGQRHNIYASEQ